MELSYEGLLFIKKHEGVVYKVYDDGAGYWTAGVGHLLSPAEKKAFEMNDKVSDAQVDAWLREDLAEANDCVNTHVTVKLNQVAFDSLVSFVFNVGCEAFKKSTLLRYVNLGLWEDAAGEFQRWTHADGKVMAGLVKRRESEMNLFMKGQLSKEAV